MTRRAGTVGVLGTTAGAETGGASGWGCAATGAETGAGLAVGAAGGGTAAGLTATGVVGTAAEMAGLGSAAVTGGLTTTGPAGGFAAMAGTGGGGATTMGGACLGWGTILRGAGFPVSGAEGLTGRGDSSGAVCDTLGEAGGAVGAVALGAGTAAAEGVRTATGGRDEAAAASLRS